MHIEWLLNVTCLLGKGVYNAAIDMINEPGWAGREHQAEKVEAGGTSFFVRLLAAGVRKEGGEHGLEMGATGKREHVFLITGGRGIGEGVAKTTTPKGRIL